STLIIRALIIVAPSLLPFSAHNCHLSLPINDTYQCLSVYINATYQCPSELPFSANYHCHQCHLSVCISATYQCRLTVPCQSVLLISASQ
ncbi:unnamed protein product, partial [Staurois parvus]